MTKHKKRTRPSAGRSPTAGAASSFRWNEVLRWAAPALIGLAAVGMLTLSWRTWPDPVVDFGRELYVPWRIAEGEVLYRDLAYFNGPLSPYVNALWFRLFGASLLILVLANLAILALLLALLYRLLTEIGSRVAALLGCLVCVTVFAFARYTIGGNYNYMCPYSHEMTHGLTLSLAALYFVSRFGHSGRLRDVALCGLSVGLVSLTKPELFLAILPATVVGCGLTLSARNKLNARNASYAAASYLGAVVAPGILALALLSIAMPPATAFADCFAAFRWSFSPDIAGQPFYRHWQGTDAVGENLAMLGRTTLCYAIFLGLSAGVALVKWPSRLVVWISMVCFVAAAVSVTLLLGASHPADAIRPFGLVSLAALAGAVAEGLNATDAAQRVRLALTTAVVLFALLLLAKIVLFVRITHYGFVLAMPVTMVMVVALWDWIPELIAWRGGSRAIFRGAALATILFVSLRYLDASRQHFAALTVRVGSGSDAFWADDRGHEVNRLLEEVDRYVPTDGTLTGVPEGAMFNYLSRRRMPTPFVTLMPIEMLMFGEEQMLAAFQQDPPDFIIGTDESVADYGGEVFGSGYAEIFHRWIMNSYHQRGREPRPTRTSIFHAALLERNDAIGAVPGASQSGSPAPSDASP